MTTTRTTTSTATSTTTSTATTGPTGLRAGLGLMVLSAAMFSTSGTFAASLLTAGWTSGAAVTVRVALAVVLLTGPVAVVMRGRWHLLRRSWRPVVGYGLFAVAACQLAYFNAVERLGVGVALLLEYLAPVLVVGWMWLRHGQRPSPLTTLGAATAVAGLALVLDVLDGAGPDPVGVAWGLCAALGLAMFYVLSAHTDAELPPLAMAWGGLATGGLVLGAAGAAGVLPMAAPRADVVFAGAQVSWLWPVLGLALFAAAVAYVTGIEGTRRLGARLASFVGLTKVVFAVLFAWLLLAQAPTALQVVGGAVVLAGVGIVKYAEGA